MADPSIEAVIWQTLPQMEYCALVDGGMLFDARGECVHHLNASAACVWETCQKGARLAAITDAICSRFHVTPQEAEPDIKAILAQFQRARLLVE